MAAITGLVSSIRVGPIGPGPCASIGRPDAATSLRSKPAQKVPFAPASTATDRFSSSSKRVNASRSASAVATPTALRTCGRSMVTVATAPSTSYRMVLEGASLVVVFHEGVAVIGGRRVRLLDHARADPADQVEERAGLVVGARRARAAERLQAYDSACRLVVDVEVAGRVDEPLRRLADRLPVPRENRARQPVRTGAVAQV